ncbi:hypothetical protein M3Y99_01391100 [Aphelenchoides fujianensis]|nr:hypothetical protein M3Y99_01391100 [Aphelenchoides fujianensis]
MKLHCGVWAGRKDSCFGGLHVHRGAFIIGLLLMVWHGCNFLAGIMSICTTTADPSADYAEEGEQPPGGLSGSALALLIERANNLTIRQVEIDQRVRTDPLGTFDELLLLQREMRELLNDIDAKKNELAEADDATSKLDRKFTVAGVLLTLVGFLVAMFMTFGNYSNRTSFYKPYLVYEPLIIGLHFVLSALFVSIICLGAFTQSELQKHTELSETSLIFYGIFFSIIGSLRTYGYLIVRQSRNLLDEAIDLVV